MRTVLRFIIKQHNLLLFFLLEIFAISLTIRNNDYQRAISFNVFDEITGNIHNVYYEIRKYFFTVEENSRLAKENALLRAELLNKISDSLTPSTHFKEPVYQLIPANIVYATVYSANNYLILNKGSNDSIEPDMGVICPTGVIGIVKTVSPNFSTVIPIINVNAHISAKVKRNQYFGTTSWDAKSSSYVNLSDIPYHVKLKKGDTIVTSGFSTIFPEGIMIGTIENFNFNEGNDFYFIEVKLSTEFNKINHVYVIRNKLKKEFNEIEKEIKDAQQN